MKKIILFLILALNLLALDDFSKVVDIFMQHELRYIAKPLAEIELVKDEFETSKEFNVRVNKARLSQKKPMKTINVTILKNKKLLKK